MAKIFMLMSMAFALGFYCGLKAVEWMLNDLKKDIERSLGRED